VVSQILLDGAQLHDAEWANEMLVVIGSAVFAARCFASAVYAVMQCHCVCLCVCLSRSYILSKRINMSSKFFHCWVATPF